MSKPLHRRHFLLVLGGTVACAPLPASPPAGGRGRLRSGRVRGDGAGDEGWLQPIWNGFGPPIETSRPLLEVFHSEQAWRRFIEPLWPEPQNVVRLDGFDWSEWVLLLMLTEPSGDSECRLVLREVARQADGKVSIGLDTELDPKAIPGLDVVSQMSMLARGSRTVFRPDTLVEFEVAARKGAVTHH